MYGPVAGMKGAASITFIGVSEGTASANGSANL